MEVVLEAVKQNCYALEYASGECVKKMVLEAVKRNAPAQR